MKSVKKTRPKSLTGLQALPAAQPVQCMVCEKETTQAHAIAAPWDGWWVCNDCAPKVKAAAAARQKETGHA